MDRLDLQIEQSSGAEARPLLEQKASVLQLSGDLTQAIELYKSLYISNGDLRYKLKELQLRYEIGHWEMLPEISDALLHSQGDLQLSLVILESRLLISQGFWEEASELLDSYKTLGQRNSQFLYIYEFIHRVQNQEEKAFWARSTLASLFPQSPESLILQGRASESPRPSMLTLKYPQNNPLYYYQAAAFQDRTYAENLMKEIQELGLQVYILQEEGFYKLLISSNQPQDEALAEQLSPWGLKPFRVQY
ncbi:MAG: SPOR domain-containing protein [Spirochaetaceae bacterium]|jgi:hypothetical protein|nr:SPOR domain-containing protein [Spirochaetaceae bacterium]